MDVHDAAFKCAQKFTLEHAHKSREHNQIHLRRLQRADKRTLCLLVQFGAEFPRRDESRRNFPVPRMRQNPRVFDIAQNQRDRRRNISRRARLRNGDKVGAFAGAEDTQTEWIAHGNLNSKVNARNKVERM